jgi:hypothetical protein
LEHAVIRGSWERVIGSCGFKFQMAAKFAAAHTPPPPQQQHGKENVKKRPLRRFRRNERSSTVNAVLPVFNKTRHLTHLLRLQNRGFWPSCFCLFCRQCPLNQQLIIFFHHPPHRIQHLQSGQVADDVAVIQVVRPEVRRAALAVRWNGRMCAIRIQTAVR